MNTQTPKVTVKIDCSNLPTVYLETEDGRKGVYNLNSYQGNMGCGIATLSNISLSGGFLNKAKTAYDPVNWETTEELVEACSKHLVKALRGYSLVVLADAVNRGTPFKDPYMDTNTRAWETGRFIKYLAKYSVGQLYLSPIATNRTHKSSAELSFCQVAVWVPPAYKDHIIPNTGGVYGDTEYDLGEWTKQHAHITPALTGQAVWDYIAKKAMPSDNVLFEKALKRNSQAKVA